MIGDQSQVQVVPVVHIIDLIPHTKLTGNEIKKRKRKRKEMKASVEHFNETFIINKYQTYTDITPHTIYNTI